ncbi:MAG: DUF262 domain-containing protein [Maricaulis sp.]|uniref:HNH endonuclease family protein n=1 Tax=Maricaulis sp. TaxID=1486257 RepID=UPI00263640E8|nr:DUF262 domain-containing protein [Maricaulis sp.]MDM7984462.1 DUF262 domain-containing protein [Maricaulis sp.]
MAKKVALDGMIRRADFAQQDEATTVDLFEKIEISKLESSNPIAGILRKPDFQRETNHWTPEQVATLVSSFANGELIPSLILWKSDSYLFVIDGGHRLSALRAWVEDDYGDGPISNKFYGGEISDEQKTQARRARRLVETKVGKYANFLKIDQDDETVPPAIKKLSSNIITRGIPIQWIQGNQEVAEASFFKINSQGTPLDKVEELLLKNRKKSYAIGSRSIVRAGFGHKYWSKFEASVQSDIEESASEIHNLLFQPEANHPIKTLDLPLGGTASPVEALKMLLDTFAITQGYTDPDKRIRELENDEDGTDTLRTLKDLRKVSRRITGTNAGSLGLHPAVYFYNEKGRHSRFFFLGTVKVFADAVRNNNDNFFKEFTAVRGALEKKLIEKKSVINQGLSNVNSRQRIDRMANLTRGLISTLQKGERASDKQILSLLGIEGRLGKLKIIDAPAGFTDDTKAAIFLQESLKSALKCPICGGYLDPAKAASFDHIQRKQDGGKGEASNGQLTHPYCNSAIKN